MKKINWINVKNAIKHIFQTCLLSALLSALALPVFTPSLIGFMSGQIFCALAMTVIMIKKPWLYGVN